MIQAQPTADMQERGGRTRPRGDVRLEDGKRGAMGRKLDCCEEIGREGFDDEYERCCPTCPSARAALSAETSVVSVSHASALRTR